MLKHLISLFGLLLLNYFINAQSLINTFTLNGLINADSGKIRLIPVGEDIYYPDKKGTYETQNINGKFYFEGTIKYPYAFRIRFDNDATPLYISDIFFIDSGKQNIVCNINSSWKTPTVSNLLMNELENDFKYAFDVVKERSEIIDKTRDSLNIVYQNKIPIEYSQLLAKQITDELNLENRTLLGYVKKNNTSFVALWSLINKISYGYEVIYDSIYMQFSDSLKNTYTGKVLRSKISLAKKTSVGSIFPKMELLDREFKINVLPQQNKNKYILIDFWFSHCNPCISQFTELNQLFEVYNPKGFDIIGVSTDGKKDIQEWRNVIKKHNLLWNQFLDLNGKVANKLVINKYPTNFLLNEKGEIIARDIESFELKIFLESNL